MINLPNYRKLQNSINQLNSDINNALMQIGSNQPNSYLQINQGIIAGTDINISNILSQANKLFNNLDASDFNNPQIGAFFEKAFKSVSDNLNKMIDDTTDQATKDLIQSITRATNTATSQTYMGGGRIGNTVKISEETLTYFSTQNKKGNRQAAVEINDISVSGKQKTLKFSLNRKEYRLSSTGQQKADIVLDIKDNDGMAQKVGLSLKNWKDFGDSKSKFDVYILNSIFQTAGGMTMTKNFLYMMQDSPNAKRDKFTGTPGNVAIQKAIEMAKVCGAASALMGLGQKSESRAQLLVINNRAKKEIKILNIPNILLNYINGYGPLNLDNETALLSKQSKLNHLGYSLHNNFRSYNGDAHFYTLAVALMHTTKLKYSLT